MTALLAGLLAGARRADRAPAGDRSHWPGRPGRRWCSAPSTWPATGCPTGSPIRPTRSAGRRCSSTPPCSGRGAALARAVAAAAVAFVLAAGAAAVSPAGLGFGDVKLLGLLGLLLGWAGWGVLLAGIFLGLLTGALVSLVLLATRRAGWRTALPFGPPLLAGAVLALALGTTGSLG